MFDEDFSSSTAVREIDMSGEASTPWPTELRLHKDRKTLTIAFDTGEAFDLGGVCYLQ